MMGDRRLIGREDEMRVLKDSFRSCVDGATVVTLSGEAGVGKTALIDQLAHEVVTGGDQVLRGNCTMVLSEPIPYAPISAALRSAGVTTTDLSVTNRGAFFEGLLDKVTRVKPLHSRQLMALDDLHWGDGGTMELIGFLARNLPPGHLLVLSYRSDEAPLDPAAQLMLETIAANRQFWRLDVQRLGRSDIAALFAEQRERPATDSELDILTARSGGNLLIAMELIEAGDITMLPPRLQDVLALRAAVLSVRARRLVQSLALLGRPVSHDLLGAIAGFPMDVAGRAIAECVAAGIVLVQPDGQHYTFRHVLTQDALIAALLPGERQRIHHRIAVALAALPGARQGAGALAERAAHWRASGHHRKAFEATEIAAAQARATFAYSDSWRQYEHLIELLDNGFGPQSSQQRSVLLSTAAEAARLAGAADAAVLLAQRAGEDLQDVGAGAEILELLGRCRWDTGDAAGAALAYSAAFKLVHQLPPMELQVRILASQARLAIQTGRYQDAQHIATQAIALAGLVSAPADKSRALTTLGMSEVLVGDHEAGIRTMRLAARQTLLYGDDDDRRRVAANMSFALLIAGHTQEACRTAVDALTIARRENSFVGAGALLVNNAIVLLRISGRWSEAEELSDSAFAEGVTVGQALLIRLARAELDMGRGNLADARENLDAAAYLGERETSISISADLALAEANWMLGQGELDSAAGWIDRAVDVLTSGSDTRDLARACALGLRIEADRRAENKARRLPTEVTGAAERASKLRQISCGLASGQISPEIAALCALAAAEWARSEVSADALTAWWATVRHWRELERPLELAYAQFRHAEAAMATDRTLGAKSLKAAQAVAQELGARLLLDSISDLARRSRVRLATTKLPAPAGGVVGGPADADEFGLTRREREVLDELAGGLTNKQIAARLFLSPRTVDVHVGNVLMKLSARTRTEAVATAARLVRSPERTRAGVTAVTVHQQGEQL